MLAAEALDKNVPDERLDVERRDGLAARRLAKRINVCPVRVPVGRAVIDDEPEAHALDVNDDALVPAAQDPRVASLVAAARPVVPDLGAGLGEVVQHQPRLGVEADGAVLRGDAGRRGEEHVAAAGVGAEHEAPLSKGLLAKAQLDGSLGRASRRMGQLRGQVAGRGGGYVYGSGHVGREVCCLVGACAACRGDQPGDDVSGVAAVVHCGRGW